MFAAGDDPIAVAFRLERGLKGRTLWGCPIGTRSLSRPATGDQQLKLTLRYRRIDCLRCGGQRTMCNPCPECGLRPPATEVDHFVRARQKAVGAALAGATADKDPSQWTSAALVGSGTFVRLLDEISVAGAAAADMEADGPTTDLVTAQLAGAASHLMTLQHWAGTHPRLRPTIELDRAAAEVLGALADLYETVCTALVAETPSEAQGLAGRVQSALDRAAAACSRANAIRETIERTTGASDPTAAWLHEAIGSDPAAAVERGAALFADSIGIAAGPQTGLNTAFSVACIEVVGDPLNFWQLAREHYWHLSRASDGVADALATPELRRRGTEVFHDLWSGARRAAHAPKPETEREWATAMLESGHAVIESALKFHLGVACAATTRMSFAQTQAADVSELANIAKDKRWAVAPQLGSDAVRNAYAHRDYFVDSSGIVLSAAKGRVSETAPVRRTFEELHDEVLRFIEVAAAMDLALLAFAEQSGTADYVDLGHPYLAGVLLSALGWTDVRVEERASTLRITANVPGEVQGNAIAYPMTVAVESTLVAVEMRLHRTDTGDRRVVWAPVALYREWLEFKGGEGSEATYLDFLGTTTYDGAPVVSVAQIRKAVAVSALPLLATETDSIGALQLTLSPWRRLARKYGLADLDKAIGRALRLRATPHSENALAAAIEQIVANASEVVDPVTSTML